MSLRRKCQELGSSCCVPSCSRLDRGPSFTSYHRFPNTKIRTKWITAIQNVTKNLSWEPEPEGAICSRHFLASDVFRREEDDVTKTTLRATAVPSVNLYPVAKDELGDNHDDDDDAVEIKMEDDIDQTAFDPFEVANQFIQQDGDDDSDKFCITPSPQLSRRRGQAQNRTLRKRKRYDSSPAAPRVKPSKSRTRSKAVSRTSCRTLSKTMHRPKTPADRDPTSKLDPKTRSVSVRKRVTPSQKPVPLPPRKDDENGHGDTPRKLNICPTCRKMYTTKSQLLRHIRRHTGEKPAKCDHCEEAFFDKPALDRHVALTHTHTKSGHICHVCGNSFALLKGLTNHLRRHDESRRHVCDTCGQKFVDRNKLRSHQVREHGADPWVCDQCGATFTTVGGLRIHVMAHTGEKPYKCDTCQYSSLSKESLAKHKRTHTGERPFHCPHCESAFVASCDLKRHIRRIHTPDYVAPLLHSCPECGKGFKRRYVLDAHIRRGHKGPSPATSPGVEK